MQNSYKLFFMLMLEKSFLSSYLISMPAPLIVVNCGFINFQLQLLYNSKINFKPPFFDVECWTLDRRIYLDQSLMP